jgi:electron transfer flavoprotein beta subunit
MKILVCIKAVPDSESVISIDDSESWIKEINQFRMNRFDEFALEEALSIKDRDKTVKIDVISIGSENSRDVIKRAIGMGADSGILISVNKSGYLSPFMTARYISSYVKEKEYDIILTGVMSEDYMQGQVGLLMAEMLGMPCASFVVKQEVLFDSKSLYAEREVEGGLIESVKISLPAVLTIHSGINKPRYPSLSNMLRAGRAEIKTIDPELTDGRESGQKIVRLTIPEKRRKGVVLAGSVKEKAAWLLKILKDKAFIN